MAWNYGARARRLGFDLPALAGDLGAPAVLALEPPELEAMVRLGPEPFHGWAVRGWIA